MLSVEIKINGRVIHEVIALNDGTGTVHIGNYKLLLRTQAHQPFAYIKEFERAAGPVELSRLVLEKYKAYLRTNGQVG